MVSMQIGKNQQIKKHVMQYVSFLAIIILVLIFTFLDKSFVNRANLGNLLSDTAPLMVMASGMTFVLLLGSVDLSTGGICSVANVLVVKYIAELSESIGNIYVAAVLAYVIAVSFGVFAGLLLGFLQAKVKMPSFIASLGFMSIWKSTALLIRRLKQ